MRGLEVRGYTTGIKCRDKRQRKTPEYRREQDVRIEAEAGGAVRLAMSEYNSDAIDKVTDANVAKSLLCGSRSSRFNGRTLRG